jgi:homocysteine S-methyltransferase
MLHDGSEYRGNYGLSIEQLVAFHEARVDVLARCGADLLACETMPSWIEVEALLTVLKRFPGMPAWISFTSADGVHTSEGQPLLECARKLDAVPSVVAIGVNCVSPDLVGPALRLLRGGTRKPLVAYPNSGEHWDGHSQVWTGGGSNCELSDRVPEWIAAGARLIGGCCRTGPAEIARIRAVCDGGLAMPSAPRLE